MENTLKGQIAWITGASQGIGERVAHLLAAQGVHLALTARNMKKLGYLAEAIKEEYTDVEIITAAADVRDAHQVNEAAQAILARFGKIDILVNNAGVAGKIALLSEISYEEIDRVIDTNLKGAIYAMKAVLPSMTHHQSGAIININSMAGKTAFPYWSVYDASKFGLRAITEAVAEEQRQNNIKVVGIYPGAVDTPLWNTIELEHEPDLTGMLDADDVASAVLYVLQQPQKVFIPELTLTPLKPAL